MTDYIKILRDNLGREPTKKDIDSITKQLDQQLRRAEETDKTRLDLETRVETYQELGLPEGKAVEVIGNYKKNKPRFSEAAGLAFVGTVVLGMAAMIGFGISECARVNRTDEPLEKAVFYCNDYREPKNVANNPDIFGEYSGMSCDSVYIKNAMFRCETYPSLLPPPGRKEDRYNIPQNKVYGEFSGMNCADAKIKLEIKLSENPNLFLPENPNPK